MAHGDGHQPQRCFLCRAAIRAADAGSRRRGDRQHGIVQRADGLSLLRRLQRQQGGRDRVVALDGARTRDRPSASTRSVPDSS
ncbi:MAG: hypothetical protein MZV64_33510 [Ignavibacteriales bacterium]|nr:hypothetical protein [Ignavibacteriales bacterium]